MHLGMWSWWQIRGWWELSTCSFGGSHEPRWGLLKCVAPRGPQADRLLKLSSRQQETHSFKALLCYLPPSLSLPLSLLTIFAKPNNVLKASHQPEMKTCWTQALEDKNSWGLSQVPRKLEKWESGTWMNARVKEMVWVQGQESLLWLWGGRWVPAEVVWWLSQFPYLRICYSIFSDWIVGLAKWSS